MTKMFLEFKQVLIFKNGHIWANRQQIWILRAHSFLQLLKFEKASYLYFFDYRPFGWDMIINKIQTSLIFTVSNHRLTSSTPYKRSYILARIFAKSLDHCSHKYWRCITQISPADLDRSKTRNILNMVFIWGFGCTLQRKFGHRFSPIHCLYNYYPISWKMVPIGGKKIGLGRS